MRVWRKLASAKWADAWEERLRFLGPRRLVVDFLPGGKSVRLEAYDVTPKEAALLKKAFGGDVRPLAAGRWMPALEPNAKTIAIRGCLVVAHSGEAASAAVRSHPGRRVLLIPGGTAFGTGDHATTAACLRLLADAAAERTRGSWEHLDLGTGSGILAIAATMLGATGSTAIDFDRAALRTARANARINRMNAINFAHADLTRWSPGGVWHVITANLFSAVLIQCAPAIRRALAPGGALIVSGILRAQEEETLGAFSSRKLAARTVVRRGKWIAARFDPQ